MHNIGNRTYIDLGYDINTQPTVDLFSDKMTVTKHGFLCVYDILINSFFYFL